MKKLVLDIAEEEFDEMMDYAIRTMNKKYPTMDSRDFQTIAVFRHTFKELNCWFSNDVVDIKR